MKKTCSVLFTICLAFGVFAQPTINDFSGIPVSGVVEAIGGDPIDGFIINVRDQIMDKGGGLIFWDEWHDIKSPDGSFLVLVGGEDADERSTIFYYPIILIFSVR